MSKRYGLQIPINTQIGPGLYIGHGLCVVIHPNTKIGKNCNLSQFTTIGSNHDTPACIGDNAVIGAGAVVVKDVPAGKTVGGNPAKVISDNSRDLTQPDLWPS
jgi:serine O-acetyltransferase